MDKKSMQWFVSIVLAFLLFILQGFSLVIVAAENSYDMDVIQSGLEEKGVLRVGMEAFWDSFNYFGNIYAGVNTPNDHCNECNWSGESHFIANQGYTCPNCGNNNPDRMNVVRRLCGYLGHPNKRPVVAGKQYEINARIKHE